MANAPGYQTNDMHTLVSLVVSFPLLLGVLAADVLIEYEAVTGYTRLLRSPVDSLPSVRFAALLLTI